MSEEIAHIIKLTGAIENLRGTVETGFKSMGDHISHVSKKADTIREELNTFKDKADSALDDHKNDIEAHGAGAVQKHSNAWIAWGGLLLGVVGLVAPWLWEALKRH